MSVLHPFWWPHNIPLGGKTTLCFLTRHWMEFGLTPHSAIVNRDAVNGEHDFCPCLSALLSRFASSLDSVFSFESKFHTRRHFSNVFLWRMVALVSGNQGGVCVDIWPCYEKYF